MSTSAIQASSKAAIVNDYANSAALVSTQTTIVKRFTTDVSIMVVVFRDNAVVGHYVTVFDTARPPGLGSARHRRYST